jgi:hypothetical protein
MWKSSKGYKRSNTTSIWTVNDLGYFTIDHPGVWRKKANVIIDIFGAV